MTYRDFKPINNEMMGSKKPSYIGIQDNNFHNFKDAWRKNYIPFFGLLSSRYSRGMNDAYDLITNRYVRMKGIVWPNEFVAYRNLFLQKHPEYRGSRCIDKNYFYSCGAYWHEKRGMICKLFLGEVPVLAGEPISPKPEKRNKEFIRLSTIQMQRIAKGYK